MVEKGLRGASMEAAIKAEMNAELDTYESLYEGPAVYANRCYVSLGAVVRLTFMEQQQIGPNAPTGPMHFRAAVALDVAQAVALSNVLKNMLGDVERQIKEAEANATRNEVVERGKNG